VPPDMYPPPPPTVSGNTISIYEWLAQPARVQRTITDLTAERFVADRVLAPGPRATGGAVIFDQVLASELYAARDIQAIEPGSEFPIVTTTEAAPLVARTIKWGGAGIITYEQRDRDDRDQLARTLTRIRNTIVKKVDAVAIASLLAAPHLTQAASGTWTSGTAAIFKDVATAVVAVDKLDMGYTITDALISPTTELNMITNDKLMGQLPRESNNRITSPIASIRMQGLLGLTWYPTNRVADDDVILVAGRTVGSISDEKPLYSRVVDQPAQERVLVMAARLTVPFITDPKACVRIQGVA
jgi:hypothetical protein